MIATDKWLLKDHHPLRICKKLISYFDNASEREIYQYLLHHGMYNQSQDTIQVIKALIKKNSWGLIEKDYEHLKREWSGPEIPIFIFPANTTNIELIRSFNGKSGLAFHDKLFLFLSERNEETEMKSLLTHEYNHVCRLQKYKRTEEYNLLDSIILEGLAESAVKERFGDLQTASWTKLYSQKQLINMWQKFIKPNIELKKSTKQHNDLLYGIKVFYPKMCGYSVGYYIVQKTIKLTALKSKDLLSFPTDKILQLAKLE